MTAPLARYRQMIGAMIRPTPPDAPQPRRAIDQLLLRYAPLLSPTSPEHAAALESWSHVTPPAVPDSFPARDGSQLILTCWSALALFHVGNVLLDTRFWEAGDRTFGRLIDRQRPSGALLETTASDNPETTWYHELILLHAATSWALYRPGCERLLPSIRRAARYHIEETQPDHATTQPWSLNAFLLSPDTHPLADQVLHTLHTQHPAGVSGVPAVLLADTLLALEHSGDQS